MKYAFMTFSCPNLTLEETLAVAQEYGYDGIEPRAEAGHKHGVELNADAIQRRAIKETVEASGIALCCLATSCTYADPEQAAKSAEETRAYIDLASDVGCPRLRVFGGRIPQGVDRKTAMGSIVESLKSVAEHAGQRDVIVAIETHDDWCNPEHIAEIMRRVDHPAIAVNWDIMHPVRQGGAVMNSAFETLKPWIKHVHFHDGLDIDDKLQMLPIGQGMIDHATAVKHLISIGYDGFLSGEWIDWKPYADYLGSELATMKKYEAS